MARTKTSTKTTPRTYKRTSTKSKVIPNKSSNTRFSLTPDPSLSSSPPPDPVPTTTPNVNAGPTSPSLDKNLVLRIVVAKLEASKNCDWFQLAQGLAVQGSGCEKKGSGGKGRRGKEEGYSGTELCELYHNSILPGLKAGRALWHENAPTAPSTPSTLAPVTPRAQAKASKDEFDMIASGSEYDGIDVEEEVKVNVKGKKAQAPRNSGVKS